LLYKNCCVDGFILSFIKLYTQQDAYNKGNFNFLSQSGTTLEKKINLLSEVIKEINNTQDKPNKTNDSEADAMKQNLRSYFSKNKKFEVKCEISCVWGGDLVDSAELEDLSVSDIVCGEYARLVSCDVEHTFSQYKSAFRDNRHRFAIQT
jgi:hypothetical protein